MFRIIAALLTILPFVKAANHAIDANPSNTDIGLTTHASDWLWAVFAVMLLSDIIFVAWSMKILRGARVFHQLPIMILTVSSIAYFCMASNLGQTGVLTEFRERGTRSVWYVRYVDWAITTPLLLLELLLITGLALSEIVTAVFFSVAMIVCVLVGSLIPSSYKWGLYTMAVVFQFYIWWIVLGPGRITSSFHGTNVRRAYTRNAFFLMSVMALYPIAWALAEYSNTISVTGEMVFYGILDILSRPVFCFMYVSALRAIPYSAFGFASGRVTDTGGVADTGEKAHLRDGTATTAATSNITHDTHNGNTARRDVGATV